MFNRHHKISKCMKADYNVENPVNIEMMEVTRHNALHALFQTLHTPKDQFMYINDLRLPVQSDYVRTLVEIINKIPVEERYQPWLVKKKKIKRWWF